MGFREFSLWVKENWRGIQLVIFLALIVLLTAYNLDLQYTLAGYCGQVCEMKGFNTFEFGGGNCTCAWRNASKVNQFCPNASAIVEELGIQRLGDKT